MIYISNIFSESVFTFMYNTVLEDGGDGACALICDNPEEVCKWFIEHCKTQFHNDLLQTRQLRIIDLNTYIIHDSNENFIFTNNQNIKLWNGDAIVRITSDVLSGISNKTIKAINNEQKCPEVQKT